MFPKTDDQGYSPCDWSSHSFHPVYASDLSAVLWTLTLLKLLTEVLHQLQLDGNDMQSGNEM